MSPKTSEWQRSTHIHTYQLRILYSIENGKARKIKYFFWWNCSASNEKWMKRNRGSVVEFKRKKNSSIMYFLFQLDLRATTSTWALSLTKKTTKTWKIFTFWYKIRKSINFFSCALFYTLNLVWMCLCAISINSAPRRNSLQLSAWQLDLK